MNNIPTFCGMLAIIFWSSSVAIIKSLSPTVSSVTQAAFVYLSGGIVLLILDYFPDKKFGFLSFSRKYHYICGSLFVACMVTFYLAIGLAKSKEATVGVGLVNYTWPSLTLILSIPILKKVAKPSLALGIILATLGVYLAANTGSSIREFFESIEINSAAYTSSAIAALTWGFYSNYSIKLGQEVKGNAVSIFMFATGLLILPYCIAFENFPELTTKSTIELLFLAATNTTAYLFWDYGIRKGNVIVVSSFAYLAPLFSTICTCGYLGLPIDAKILIASLLIITGAFVCSRSVR